MGEGDEDVRRIAPRPGSGVKTFHGPVEVDTSRQVHVVRFTGSEESDLLYAAGAWMAEHPYATLVALDWRDETCDHDDLVPRWQLDLIVDREHDR